MVYWEMRGAEAATEAGTGGHRWDYGRERHMTDKGMCASFAPIVVTGRLRRLNTSINILLGDTTTKTIYYVYIQSLPCYITN